MKFKVMFTFLL